MSTAAERKALVRDVEAQVTQLAEELAGTSLDRSYDSLDPIEDFFLERLARDASDKTLESRLAMYVGATLSTCAGGRWELPRAKEDLGQTFITKLPHIERAKFYPSHTIGTFKRTRFPGYIRDNTRRYDIAQRRSDLAETLAQVEGELEAFRAELTVLLGRDPGDLAVIDNVDAIEEALCRIVASGRSREQFRRVQSRAVMALGTIVKCVVDGDWEVCEQPTSADIGQFEIHGWAPISVVRNVGPKSRSGLLRDTLGMVIEARSKSR